MSAYKKLAKNSAIFAIGNFSSKFISLIMLPFYTRFLSQDGYGEIDIITTTIAFLLPIFTVSIVEAVVRFSLDKKNYNYSEVLSNSILFVVLGSIALLGLYPFISATSIMQSYGFILYCLFVIQAIQTSIKQFARSINLSKVYMLSDILNTFTFVIANIIFIFFLNMGVEGYLVSMFISYAVDLVYLSIKTNALKYIKIQYIHKNTVKKMFFYCLPLMPTSLMWWVMNISDRYIIVYFIGLGANGIYAVANKFPTIVSNFYTIFFRAWQISAIEEHQSENKEKFYSNVFNVFFFAMIIITSMYIAFNKIIIRILVDEKFYECWKYAPILVLGVAFSSFSAFIGTNYVAFKKTRGALYTAVLGAAINFVLNLVLVPMWGIYGASITTMVSFFIMWIARVFDTRKFIKIKYPTLKMTLVLFFIVIQIIIGYLDINSMVSWLLSLTILLLIIVLSGEYIKEPFFMLLKKVKNKKKVLSN